jgi:hypothetical protein
MVAQPETLGEFAILALVCALLCRAFFLIPSCLAIIRLFGKDVREGLRLFSSLEVPGLQAFVRQELILATIPFLALAATILYVDEGIELQSLSSNQVAATFGLFFFWVTFDIFRSYTAGAHLRMMAQETKSFGRKMAISALDGLRYAVYLRPSVSKTAAKLGARAAIGLAQKRIKEHDKENRRTAASFTAMIFLERFVTFPERIVGRVTDFGKERLEANWEDAFTSYASRSWWKNVALLLWGLLPAAWLAGMTHLMA